MILEQIVKDILKEEYSQMRKQVEWDGMFDKAAEYKVMPKEFYKRVQNRIKLITTTLDQRNIPKKLTGRWLLERELMGGAMNDKSTATGDNLIYNYNQHTNQVEAPDWGVPAN